MLKQYYVTGYTSLLYKSLLIKQVEVEQVEIFIIYETGILEMIFIIHCIIKVQTL